MARVWWLFRRTHNCAGTQSLLAMAGWGKRQAPRLIRRSQRHGQRPRSAPDGTWFHVRTGASGTMSSTKPSDNRAPKSPVTSRAGPTTRIYMARALRDFGDGFVAVLLPVYLTILGLGPLEIGIVATLSETSRARSSPSRMR